MNSTLPLLTDIPATELRGKRVLLRLDLNVPIAGDQVIDDFRIVSSLPTIEYLRQAGARVAIISHLGRKPEEVRHGIEGDFRYGLLRERRRREQHDANCGDECDR